MKQLQCLLFNNDCYDVNDLTKPTRIVVHSTGANNPYLNRYVQPHTKQTSGMGGDTREHMLQLLGKNKYANDWNRSGIKACVHAFIGKLADGSIATVQTLPWNTKCWGSGKGAKGTLNYSSIQFEICEDDMKSKSYCQKTYNEAVEFCAMLCKRYNIPADKIISHKEAYEMGYGSNHGDPDHWWKKHGFSMSGFRKAVKEKLNSSSTLSQEPYKVKITVEDLNVRAGAGTQYKIVDTITDFGVYTIVETQGQWGKLKSGKGWIYLGYTIKY